MVVKIVLLYLIIAPFAAHSQNSNAYKKTLDEAEYGRKHSEKLLAHDELGMLLDDIEVTSDNDTGQPNGQSDIEARLEAERAELRRLQAERLTAEKAVIEAKRKAKKAANAPASRYQNTEPSPARTSNNNSTKGKARPLNDGGYYDPSIDALSGGGGGITNEIDYTGKNSRDRVIFGITIGTEIPVRTRTRSSNTQNGFITFEVTQDIIGYNQILPVGSKIFAQPTAAVGDARLYGNTNTGITTNNFEFSISASVIGHDNAQGLAAIVISDGRSLQRAGNASTASLLSSAIDAIPSSSITLDAVGNGLDSLAQERIQEDEKKTGTKSYIVNAPPQTGKLIVRKTF
jgi:hypothetical protein